MTTGGVGGAPEADFAGYRGRGWRWRGRLDGSAGHLKQILPGIREEGGGGGDDWRGEADFAGYIGRGARRKGGRMKGKI